jgi:hypothetical protein
MRTRLSGMSRTARVAVAAVFLLSLTGVALVVDAQGAGAVSTGQAILNEAASQAGVPYCNGGGGIDGPSQAPADQPQCSAPGYDCMSLSQFAVYQVTGITVPTNGEELPGGTDWDGQGTYDTGSQTDMNDLNVGDVVFFGGTDMWHYAHSGIYAGDGEVWDALQTGTPVEEHTISDLQSIYSGYWGGVDYAGSSTAFTITTPSLPVATVGSSYKAPLAASGGTTPYKWKAKGLPMGLHIGKKSGTISGKVRAKAVGSHTIDITVTDAAKPKQKTSTSFTLTVDS